MSEVICGAAAPAASIIDIIIVFVLDCHLSLPPPLLLLSSMGSTVVLIKTAKYRFYRSGQVNQRHETQTAGAAVPMDLSLAGSAVRQRLKPIHLSAG
jgi:hypothetical protein